MTLKRNQETGRERETRQMALLTGRVARVARRAAVKQVMQRTILLWPVLASAVVAAVSLRLRPIIMTSFAFILGVMPLVLSEGAEMRCTPGTAVFGGMLGVTLFGIFLTPVFYYVIEWTGDTWRGRSAFLAGQGARIPRPGGSAATVPKASTRSRLSKQPPTDFDST